MKTFKEHLQLDADLLIESTEESTLMEGTIVSCWNLNSKGETAFKRSILNDGAVKSWLRKSKNAKWKGTPVGKLKRNELLEALWQFSKLVVQKGNQAGAKGKASPAGQSKPGVSKFWTNTTGKGKDTSKADIDVGGVGVSVKGPKALLMSGEQKESKATAYAAFDESGSRSRIKKQIFNELDNMITSTRTSGPEWTTDAIAKASLKDIRKLKDNEQKKMNVAAKQAHETGKKVKSNLEALMTKAFNVKEVGNSFAWESMTGWEKFGGKTYKDPGSGVEGEALQMLVWSPNMEQLQWKSVKKNGPYVSKVASQMKMKADMKSGSYKQDGKKAGYSFFQTVRLNIDTAFSDADRLNEDFEKSVTKYEQYLAEGVNEAVLWDAIKGLWAKFISKMKVIWETLVRTLVQLKNKLNELWDDGIDAVMNFFEMDISVRVDPYVKLI